MGRSYWFECTRCGYREVVSGKPDRGPDFFVQTIVCFDCKRLFDAVVRMRVPVTSGLKPSGGLLPRVRDHAPPTFQGALTRLPMSDVRKYRWKTYKLLCPVSNKHRVQKWNDPGPCPRCGLVMDKNPLPYRIWE